MAAREIHKYDIGTAFEVTLKDGDNTLNLVTSSVKEIHFQKPDGTVVEKTAQFRTDGSDGIIVYITVADDLDQTGSWKIQAKVTLPTGTWSSDIEKFKVYDNLKQT